MPQQVTSKIKFIHCRNLSANNAVLPHGGLTIAYVLNEQFKVVGWAAAKCSNKDVYNKQVGRMKSEGRLSSNEYYQECPEINEQTFINQTHEGFKKNFAWNKK